MCADFDSLRNRRAELEQWLDDSGRAQTLSAGRFLLHRKLKASFQEHVHGRLLEAGAGGSPFSEQLRFLADEVVTLDVSDRYGDIDVVADVQDMPQVPSNSFDVVVCTQVLEHLPEPRRALKEMRRVLKDEGVLILSAPHLSMVHEAPNDFFRYTGYGLRSLANTSGFMVTSIEPTGGLVAFVAHPLSLAVLTLSSFAKAVRGIVWILNYVVLVRGVALIDEILGFPSLFPLDHVLIAVATDTSTSTST